MVNTMIFGTQWVLESVEYLKSIKSYNLGDPEEIVKAEAAAVSAWDMKSFNAYHTFG